MEKEKIEVGKIYNAPTRALIGETFDVLVKCIGKNEEGCLFLSNEGSSEENKFLVKNDDLKDNVKSVERT